MYLVIIKMFLRLLAIVFLVQPLKTLLYNLIVNVHNGTNLSTIRCTSLLRSKDAIYDKRKTLLNNALNEGRLL